MTALPGGGNPQHAGAGGSPPLAMPLAVPLAVPMAVPMAVIVAGPTASGKSALALALAQRLGGTVINADSMQIYRDLRIVTARPSRAEEEGAPHVLYGVRAAAEPGSVAWWRGEALAAMAVAHAAGRVPILCGGTGMYFLSLIQGLADIPPPGDAARAEARALLADIGPAALHARLAEEDPATAARLTPADGQRLARAWEVWRGTGQGLAAWQRAGNAGAAPWRFRSILLDPPRDALRGAIEARFDAMLAQGALDEVRALMAQQLSPALPAMRAHGVPELAKHLAGLCTLHQARALACIATSQYTKRQATWFRHHALGETGESRILLARFGGEAQYMERIIADMQHFIFSRVDALHNAP
jgi:tRNA dimethylallyltransferase